VPKPMSEAEDEELAFTFLTGGLKRDSREEHAARHALARLLYHSGRNSRPLSRRILYALGYLFDLEDGPLDWKLVLGRRRPHRPAAPNSLDIATAVLMREVIGEKHGTKRAQKRFGVSASTVKRRKKASQGVGRSSAQQPRRDPQDLQ
jgi:hypothetical protein